MQNRKDTKMDFSHKVVFRGNVHASHRTKVPFAHIRHYMYMAFASSNCDYIERSCEKRGSVQKVTACSTDSRLTSFHVG